MVIENPNGETQSNSHKVIDPSQYGGVVKVRGQSQLAEQYIMPAKNFKDALARTTIRDPNFLNNIVQLHGQMMEFNKEGLFNDAIEELVNLLIGQNALQGYNRSLSAMVGTGIYYPEGAGIKMSKEDKANYMEAQRLKHGQKNKDKEDGET
jgi:hypothetical protein